MIISEEERRIITVSAPMADLNELRWRTGRRKKEVKSRARRSFHGDQINSCQIPWFDNW
jgi:hypothetical protein